MLIVQAKIDIKKHPIYVECNLNDVKKNDVIIIKYNSIEYIGTVTNTNIGDNKKYDGRMIRIASKKDIKSNLINIRDSNRAFKKCNSLIKKNKLDMRLLSASYSYDRKQLLFQYVADERVDFRILAKELATIYKTRIELRQIGIRDKASIVSGLGMCGRELCCSKFLKSIDTVSINMAKNQHLALNPSKINGCCGRLLCCLNYEDDIYKELNNNLPRVGDIVSTEKGDGKVVNVQILKHSYTVDLGNNEFIEIKVDMPCNGSSS